MVTGEHRHNVSKSVVDYIVAPKGMHDAGANGGVQRGMCDRNRGQPHTVSYGHEWSLPKKLFHRNQSPTGWCGMWSSMACCTQRRMPSGPVALPTIMCIVSVKLSMGGSVVGYPPMPSSWTSARRMTRSGVMAYCRSCGRRASGAVCAWQYIRAMYASTPSSAKCGHHVTEAAHIDLGTAQGDTLSCILFLLLREVEAQCHGVSLPVPGDAAECVARQLIALMLG
jgi:hypothetical protein